MWPFKRRPSFAEAYAKALADIEREFPIDQVRASQRMKSEMDRIARVLRSERMNNGGEYENGMKGFR